MLAGERFGIVLFATLCGREPGLSELLVIHTLAGDFKPMPGDATLRPGLNCCPRAGRTREAHRIFQKDGNGFFLRDGLCELREFGEFAQKMKRTRKKSRVFVHINTNFEEYDPDILKFAVNPQKH